MGSKEVAFLVIVAGCARRGGAGADGAALVDASDASGSEGSWFCPVSGDCDPFSETSCPADQVCLPALSGGGYGPTTCFPRASMPVAEDQPCGAQECGPAHGCVPVTQDAFSLECLRLCRTGSTGACGPDKYCGHISGLSGCISACKPLYPPCDVYAQDCPIPDATCIPSYNEETATFYTGCQGAGTAAVGQPCYNGTCARGLVCVDNANLLYCEPPCRTTADCPAGKICVVTRYGPTVHACQPDPGGIGGVSGGQSPPGPTPITGAAGAGGSMVVRNPLPQAQIDAFVTAHNLARSGPLDPMPSPPLPPVTWDARLADVAYNYLLLDCPPTPFDGQIGYNPHNTADYVALGGTDYVGENIYATESNAVTASEPADAVAHWLSGGLSYDYTTNTGAPDGYLQLVWRSSVRIGCAIHDCPTARLHNTVICDYAPTGNYNFLRPY